MAELTSNWCIFRGCLVRPRRGGRAGRLTFVLPVNKTTCLKVCLGFFSLICPCRENKSLTWIFLRLPLESVNEATQDWTDLGWVQCVSWTVKGNTGMKLMSFFWLGWSSWTERRHTELYLADSSRGTVGAVDGVPGGAWCSSWGVSSADRADGGRARPLHGGLVHQWGHPSLEVSWPKRKGILLFSFQQSYTSQNYRVSETATFNHLWLQCKKKRKKNSLRNQLWWSSIGQKRPKSRVCTPTTVIPP